MEFNMQNVNLKQGQEETLSAHLNNGAGNIDKKVACEIAARSLRWAKELIYFSIQFEDAIQSNVIRPEHFEKYLAVPEKVSNSVFYINLDWGKHPDIFKSIAEDAQIGIANFAIICCKESYSKELWVEKTEDSDLYSAQMILKSVRNAIGHMSAQPNGLAVPIWDINSKNRILFEIKCLGITLDTRNLHGTMFHFSHLGGLGKFLSLLDYLEKDLQKKIALMP
jgi:hypothetical protein